MHARLRRGEGSSNAPALPDTEIDATAEVHLNNLTWLGLVGITNPIRQGVKELITDFHQAGIDTVMLTGDQENTALAIAKQLNLSSE